MAITFNDKVNPRAAVDLFKIYINVPTSGLTTAYELQGRGVTSWTIDQNQDIEKEADVLGYVDVRRGTAQPTQSGVMLYLRKDSKLGEMLFDAWFNGDMSKLDDVDILQKFEFIDGATEGKCLARLQEECVIAINSFQGEAESYLAFDVDIHYSNKITTGQMSKVDGDTITFTPDQAGE